MALLESVAAAVLLTGANYADYHTTQGALARGGVESNPLIGPNGQRLEIVKTVEIAAEVAVFNMLRKRSKPAAWIWVGAVVGYNLHIANQNRKYGEKP